jgi:lariat debranching enzyme
MKVDLLICCGDFQAMRNVDDLHCFACPPKYRAMKDFHKYYMGEKKAPIPTVFGASTQLHSVSLCNES